MAGFEDVVRLDGALYCHGSPRSDEEIITALTPARRASRRCSAGVAEALVVCGHTHHQFELRARRAARRQRRQRRDALRGRAGAFWLLVADGEPELRRTDYDVDAAVPALRASGFPDVDDLIRESLLEPVDAAFVARHFEDAREPAPA